MLEHVSDLFNRSDPAGPYEIKGAEIWTQDKVR